MIPWVTEGVDLGDHLLEIGPGPGLTTDVLRELVPRLTAVEVDPQLAEPLRRRLQGTNVTVRRADATDLPFESETFSSAVCLTMLHHVPRPELQDRLITEMARVVRHGGFILGVDSLDSPDFREGHLDDVCVPIDPVDLPARLAALGLNDIDIATNQYAFRFRFVA